MKGGIMNGTIQSCGRGVLCAIIFFASVAAAAPPDLKQGWTSADSNGFYTTTQGSRLLPHQWFLALERHDSAELFKADCLARYGYLSTTPTCLKPSELPIGFAIDSAPAQKKWFGMTCAACHTSEISFKGITFRVDGAPAGAAMYDFLRDLDLALQKALNDPQAFDRFAKKVLGAQDNPANRRKLRDDKEVGLKDFSDYFKQFVVDSTPASPWGPARLDAFGMIFNRVTNIDLKRPDNNRKPEAPVSYPFLWGTSWHTVTQWNGSVPNNDETVRLARNLGQVLGVFGTINFKKTPLYPSSAQKGNLRALEKKVSVLKAPVWPEQLLGQIVWPRVKRGADLFKANQCDTCHAIVLPANQVGPADVFLSEVAVIKTDDAMARIAATRLSRTDILENRKIAFGKSDRFGPEALTADILRHAVTFAILGGSISPANTTMKSQALRLERLFDADLNIPRYKARPLNGIWATAPYLHNGSVRNLYQLLLPAAQREAKFSVGSREFDPFNVGFMDAPGPVPFVLDTSVAGNRNTGHEYGTALDHEQRLDLIEYMKTL